jgi:hypothetical protein
MVASMGADLPNLHDAILRTIEIDWETGRASCKLSVWLRSPVADRTVEMRTVVVRLTSLKGATIPRGEPWGPSIYVNSGQLRRDEATAEFSMEMQSGDEILLRAATAEVICADPQ